MATVSGQLLIPLGVSINSNGGNTPELVVFDKWLKIISMRQVLLFFGLLCFASADAQYVLKVVDAASLEPLSFAVVSDTTTNYSAYADENGRISVPKRVRSALVSYVGYASVPVNMSDTDRSIIVKLKSDLFLPVIEVGSGNATPVFNPSVHIVSMQQLKINPMLLGEFDPLKALSMLPGVSNGAEGTAGIIIRGGNANQTAIMIDGQQVYNVNHVGGFLSAIPDYGVQFVRLYKGGVPARYGGRLSGVVDLILKNGRKDRSAYQLGVGTALLRGGAEGPIGKKITYLFSGRLGYPTLINDVFSAGGYEKAVSGSHTTVRIYDGLGKLTFTDKDWTVGVNTFLGGDSGFDQFNGSSQLFLQNFRWSNSLIGIKVNRQLNSSIFIEGGGGLTDYRYNYDEFDRLSAPDTTFDQRKVLGDLDIRDRRAFVRMQYAGGSNFSMEVGNEYTVRILDQTFRVDQQGSIPSSSAITSNNSEIVVYTNGSWTHPTGSGQITGGLRLTKYLADDFNVTLLEPRLNGSLRLLPKTFLHAGYDKQSQFVHELITSVNILPNSVWIVADPLTPPARSEQFSIGLAGEIGLQELEWSLEVFSKSMKNLVRIQPGFERDVQAGLADNTEAIATGGTGQARGVELSLKGDLGKLTYQVAYTRMRSSRTFPTVNQGEEFPFTFDRRNDLSLLMTYRSKGKWSYSSQFIYQSGYAVTLPIATSAFFDIYDSFNNARFPPFNVLNLGAKKEWKGKKSGHRQELNLSVYNVYNRANAFAGGRKRDFVPVTDPVTMEMEFAVRSTLSSRRLLGFTPGISYTRYIGE